MATLRMLFVYPAISCSSLARESMEGYDPQLGRDVSRPNKITAIPSTIFNSLSKYF